MPTDPDQLLAAGYVKCLTGTCPFFLSPEAQSDIQNRGGYYTCPICRKSYDLLHTLPWHGVSDEAEVYQNINQDQRLNQWKSGGGTKIGISMTSQGQLGEDLVKQMGEIPGYGVINWWHPGGAASQSPLDGTTKDWGIEVKTIGYDAMHHRWIPGGVRRNADGSIRDEKAEKTQAAVEMGKMGVLGVLVLLDYRRSVADIYVRAFPTEEGIKTFRTTQSNVTHLVKEVPFRNPLMDPHSPEPQVVQDNIPF